MRLDGREVCYIMKRERFMNVGIYEKEVMSGVDMSVPSKAKAIKLDNPAQRKVSHHFGTKLHMLGGNK